MEYGRIEEIFRREIDKAVSGKRPAEAYNGILKALLRLRLLCNHGTYELALQDCKRGLPSDPDNALSLLQQSDEAICAYCSCDVALVGKPNDLESGAFTVCSHLLCGDCLLQYEADLKESSEGNEARCPLCYRMIGLNFVELKKVGEGQILGSHSPPTLGAMNCSETIEGYSSKLSVLLQDLESHMHKDKR
jgi:SWI/SNF-related matrix-associated actin-dependent regulator of chromatin subfamily A3